MYICELINSPDFSFDAPLRIIRRRNDGEAVTVFDSTVSGDIHFDVMFRTVTAVSIGADGVIEIEYAG